MNIQFTINVSTFKKAAGIEESLKAQGISYSARVDDKPSLGSSKRTRVVIGKNELAAVLQCLASHVNWSHKEISKATGVSRATVGRIALGTHVLQKGNGASDISEDI